MNMYIYIYIRKLLCSDVHPREHDKAAVWNHWNSVHLIAHPVARFLYKSVHRRVWAGPCKSVQGRSVQIRAMGALSLQLAASRRERHGL